MTWDELDWNALERHRARFLSGASCDTPYWASAEDLAGYDLTFGERIGWKWDAVLDELEMRGWVPRGGTVLDWGCGGGIAGRRVLGRFGAGRFGSLLVWDHSPLAARFARDQGRQAFPGLSVSEATRGFLEGSDPIGLLVISHVLNELTPSALEAVRSLVDRSDAVLWTEPGTHEASRALGSLRDEWTKQFHVVAPCTHAKRCPVLLPGNERHWCHHFAHPPSFIFADSNWVKFGQRAGIDLRSLPYSFVALDRHWEAQQTGLARVIGRPEFFKPYARLLSCDEGGLEELSVMKRDNGSLYKELGRSKRPLVFQWTREGRTVLGGHRPPSAGGSF